MGEPTDGQKEIQALQARILTLEETIQGLKVDSFKNGKDKTESTEKIGKLETELAELKKEKSEIQKKVWDGQNRRAAGERRHVAGTRKDDKDDDGSYIGGHFG